MTATPSDLAAALFGRTPRIFCDLAELGGRPVGAAIWYYVFSTFRGRAGIHLEDLVVEAAARRRGVGGALLRNLAGRCTIEGLARLEWMVSDDNIPARIFYEGLASRPMHGWSTWRLDGEALQLLDTAHAPRGMTAKAYAS